LNIIKKISLLIITAVLSITLTGCGADIAKKPEKFKIIDVNSDTNGVVLILLDEVNNRLTKHTVYDNYKFNVDFEISSKEDMIGKYLYSDAYSNLKVDTVIKSK